MTGGLQGSISALLKWKEGVPEALQLEGAKQLWPGRAPPDDSNLYLTPQARCLSQFFCFLSQPLPQILK